jgi:hypothetical protein
MRGMRRCGLEFRTETIDRIRTTLAETPTLSKRSLARSVCEWMDWRSASGRLKEAACRKALTVLSQERSIDLPPSDVTRHGDSALPKPAGEWVQVRDVGCDLRGLGVIEIELVGVRTSKTFKIWKGLMGKYHYLGSGRLCGAQLRYLIHSSVYGYLGGLSFSSAAWALKERDKFIGWSPAARGRNLQRLICNSRFLIAPTVCVPNLASHVLSQCARRIVADWQDRYGIEPVALETFVDPRRFSGVCYRAAGWTAVGQTSGRRGRQREEQGGPKEIFFYPLRQDWKETLCEEPAIELGQRPRPDSPADWVEEELGTVEFYDGRLTRRLFSMVRDFYGKPLAPIPQALSGSQAKTKAAYRFLGNERVTMDEILRAHVESSIERIREHRVVLAVQDTSSLNYTTHRATEGLGPINTSKDAALGMLLHDTMAFTPEGIPLGLLDVQCWARDPEEMGKRHRRTELPIEQKESMKWLNSYRAVNEAQKLCPESTLVSVGDRESDIYELFLEKLEHPEGPEILVRCERSRKRKTEQGDDLWEQMAAQPVAGFHGVHIPQRGCQAAREARLEVRHAPITLQPPKNKGYPPINVWMVYAKEVDYAASVSSPLEWMLLTTVSTSNLEQACERLAWYARRWGIEVYHRTLKSGCRIEDRQLETVEGLQTCLALDLLVAWRIYHLTILGREVPDLPCTLFFEEAEWKALYILAKQATVLPDQEPSLREAIRMVASLGGFLGRKGDGEPGTTTLWRGLQSLASAAALYRTLFPQSARGP